MKNCYVEIEINISENKAFALFPFKDPYYENFENIIKPAFNSKNIICENAADEKRPTDIKKDIWNYIKNAKIVIADISGLNANVFYEMGLAHALGKPLIIIKDSITKSPFDIQGIRNIEYDVSKTRWKNKLREDIKSSVEDIIKMGMEPIYPEINLKEKKKIKPTENPPNNYNGKIKEIERDRAKMLMLEAKNIYDRFYTFFSAERKIFQKSTMYSLIQRITLSPEELGFKIIKKINDDLKIELLLHFDNKYEIRQSGISYLDDKLKTVSKKIFLQDLVKYWKDNFNLIFE